MPPISSPMHDASAPQWQSLRALIPRLSTTLPRRILTPRDAAVNPLSSLNSLKETIALEHRDIVQGIIPTYYNLSGPSPGTTVGIVLGSVTGFLLLIWLFYSLSTINGGAAIAGEEEIVVRRRRSRSPHSRRSRRSTRTEVREASRSPRRREHIIVEERREVPRPRSVIVEERVRERVPGDDIVEVFEEISDVRPPRRNSGRRGSGYRY